MSWRADDLEHVQCDGCGGDEHTPIITRRDGLRVVACNDCSLQFVSPRPKAELVSRLYDREYFWSSKSTGDATGYEDYTSEASRAQLECLADERLAIASRYLEPSGRRVLEVGCATGETCRGIASLGASVLGIDLAEYAVETARARYPELEFRVGEITSALQPNERFSAVFAFETIEHVLSPRAFLRAIRGHLEPDGVVFLSTPNADAVMRTGSDGWLGYATSFEHLYFFAPLTLRRIAMHEGLAIIDWFTGGGMGRAHSYPGVEAARRALAKVRSLAPHLRPAAPPRLRSMKYQRYGCAHSLYCVLAPTGHARPMHSAI